MQAEKVKGEDAEDILKRKEYKEEGGNAVVYFGSSGCKCFL